MKEELLFCPLGGSGEIGMNMNLFGYGLPGNHKWIMVDIGVTGPSGASSDVSDYTPTVTFRYWGSNTGDIDIYGDIIV